MSQDSVDVVSESQARGLTGRSREGSQVFAKLLTNKERKARLQLVSPGKVGL